MEFFIPVENKEFRLNNDELDANSNKFRFDQNDFKKRPKRMKKSLKKRESRDLTLDNKMTTFLNNSSAEVSKNDPMGSFPSFSAG